MTNKEIMADSLRLLKAFREALGKARTELKKKALSEMAHDASSDDTLNRFYEHDRELSGAALCLDLDIQKLGKVSDDGKSLLDYDKNGEKR